MLYSVFVIGVFSLSLSNEPEFNVYHVSINIDIIIHMKLAESGVFEYIQKHVCFINLSAGNNMQHNQLYVEIVHNLTKIIHFIGKPQLLNVNQNCSSSLMRRFV